ncbi:MAG: type III pantothenate kinase [Gammaproteobacteria bacterium]|nr:type III pantothenate kinase [Gammaproteobacteria bacterium]
MNIINMDNLPVVLMIDIGNTNLKWAWMQDGRISGIESASHAHEKPFVLAGRCWGQSPRPGRVVMANVASPDLDAGVTRWVSESWGLTTELVCTTAAAFGVTNAYSVPEHLGVDRWLTLLAVHNSGGQPTCIVDCGTAITIDVIDVHGHHLGGLILPGFNLMREALLAKTHIPRVDQTDPTHLLGTGTASAVSSAAVHAAAALVERVVERTSRQLGQAPVLVLSGSDAVTLKPLLNLSGEIKPDLVMQGLLLFAKEHQG